MPLHSFAEAVAVEVPGTAATARAATSREHDADVLTARGTASGTSLEPSSLRRKPEPVRESQPDEQIATSAAIVTPTVISRYCLV